MTIQTIEARGARAAVVHSAQPLIFDTQSALDLIMTVNHETGCSNVAINKEALAEAFFVLSSGLAGEILQKFVNYRMRLAIIGDFSGYTSKPLRDFMFESNQGRHIFFVSSQEEALEKLCG